MSRRFDPVFLEREILAAGLVHVNAGGPYIGCRSDTRSDQDGSDDLAQIIDWTQGHPTPAERAMARTVLVAHDNDRRRREQVTRRARIGALEDKGAALTDAELRELQILQIAFRREGPI